MLLIIRIENENSIFYIELSPLFPTDEFSMKGEKGLTLNEEECALATIRTR